MVKAEKNDLMKGNHQIDVSDWLRFLQQRQAIAIQTMITTAALITAIVAVGFSALSFSLNHINFLRLLIIGGIFALSICVFIFYLIMTRYLTRGTIIRGSLLAEIGKCEDLICKILKSENVDEKDIREKFFKK
jgi:hypothetical protein